jgi:hypothetical protein
MDIHREEKKVDRGRGKKRTETTEDREEDSWGNSWRGLEQPSGGGGTLRLWDQ